MPFMPFTDELYKNIIYILYIYIDLLKKQTIYVYMNIYERIYTICMYYIYIIYNIEPCMYRRIVAFADIEVFCTIFYTH